MKFNILNFHMLNTLRTWKNTNTRVKLPGQVSRYARDPQGWTEKYSRAFLYRDVLVAKVDLDTGNLTWPRD